jgi:hypothetical protein
MSTRTLMIAYKIGMRDGIGSLKDKVGSYSHRLNYGSAPAFLEILL